MEARASVSVLEALPADSPLVEVELAAVGLPVEEVRFELDEEKVEELERQITALGLLQPIGVRSDGAGWRLVWGRHRLEALRRLGWRSTFARVVGGDDVGAVLRAAVENMARHDMSAVEEGGVCARLCEAFGGDIDQVARLLRRSRGWVESRLRVLEWPSDVQQAVHRGEISAAAGAELAVVSDDQHRGFLLGHAIQGGATARTCQAWRIAWEQSGTVSSATVAQVAPGRTVPAPVEAELPCYLHGDRVRYSGLTHIWLCAEAVELFNHFRAALLAGESGEDGGDGAAGRRRMV